MTEKRDYPPLPKPFGLIDLSSMDAYSDDQMRAYVDADRAARGDAKRRWMQIADQRAIEVADLKAEVKRLRATAEQSSVGQEPVAWRCWDDDHNSRWSFTVWPHESDKGAVWEPLYTHPAPQPAPVAGPLDELAELSMLNRLIELGAKAACAHAKAQSDDGHASTGAYVHWQETRAEMAELIRNAYATPQPPVQAQEPVAWCTFDGEGGYDYRSYEGNENYAQEWANRNPNHKDWVKPLFFNPTPQPAPVAQGDAEDAARYRWLRRKVSAHVICDGWQFGFPTALSLPAPAEAMRDPAAGLDAAIDARAQAKEGASND